MKNVKNNFIVKCVIVFAVLAIAVIFLYSKLVNMKNEEASNEDYPTTTYGLLAARDFDSSYPATVSEVLKLYNKYIQYIYNNELDDDDFEVLVDKIRCMWSEEWLKLNEREEHINNFRNEVKKFMDDGKVISNCIAGNDSAAKNFTGPDGIKGKSLAGSYLYSEKGKTSKVYMQFYFVLEDGRWKLLYYETANEAEANDR